VALRSAARLHILAHCGEPDAGATCANARMPGAGGRSNAA
jgi:hypothetical protein